MILIQEDSLRPVCFSHGQWDKMSHTTRVSILCGEANKCDDPDILDTIADEVNYYANIKRQIERMTQ